MAGKLEGKKALITGASSGIGKDAALRLAREGCHVFLIARREEKLKDVQKEIYSFEGQCFILPGDITKSDFVRKAIDSAAQAFGGLDILVLAAGDGLIKPFILSELEDFRRLTEVNAFSIVTVCKAAASKLNPGASVILITSPAGINGAKGLSAYAFSKGAIVPFGKCLALELAVRSCRVNMISPGYVQTELTRKLYGRFNEAQKKRIAESYPLAAGTLADVSNAIVFFASDDSRWITGAVLPVDGGLGLGT